jgi:hypothetical protein
MALDDALRDPRVRIGRVRLNSVETASTDGPRPIVEEGTRAPPRAPENVEEHLTTTRSLPRLLTLGAGLVFVAAACNQAGTATTGPGGGAASWTPDAALLAAAKTEGTLNVIALPRDWCNYGTLLDNFKAKTGLTLNEITPDAGSGQEIDAIKNNPNGGPAAPDTVDVGFSFGDANKALYQPYKAATFESMRRDGDALVPMAKMAWDKGAERFINKGTNERWKEFLTADDLARYEALAAKKWSKAADAWIRHGRLKAGDPRQSPD